MLKRSHGYVAECVSDYFNLNCLQRSVLIFGSIFPDYYPDKLHTYENWFKYFNYKRYELMLRNKGLRYYYILGKELHLCADFFTRVHNCDNIIDFVGGHHDWEEELHKKLFNNFVIISDYKESISELHDMYLLDKQFIDIDVNYICMAISSLINKL